MSVIYVGILLYSHVVSSHYGLSAVAFVLLEFALQTVRDGKPRVTRKRKSKEAVGRENAPVEYWKATGGSTVKE